MKQIIKNHLITATLFSMFALWLNILFITLGWIDTTQQTINGFTVFYVLIAAPFLEECAFRLGLFNLIYRFTHKPKLCIAVSSITFGLAHVLTNFDKYHVVQAIYATICGAMLGTVFYFSGRKINYTIIMHVVANLVTAFTPMTIFGNTTVGWIAVIVTMLLMLILFDITITKGVLNFGKDVEEENRQADN